MYATREGYETVARHERHGRPLWGRSIFWEPRQSSFGGWQIWQFTGAGHISGITGPVDRNVLNGGGGRAVLRRGLASP